MACNDGATHEHEWTAHHSALSRVVSARSLRSKPTLEYLQVPHTLLSNLMPQHNPGRVACSQPCKLLHPVMQTAALKGGAACLQLGQALVYDVSEQVKFVSVHPGIVHLHSGEHIIAEVFQSLQKYILRVVQLQPCPQPLCLSRLSGPCSSFTAGMEYSATRVAHVRGGGAGCLIKDGQAVDLVASWLLAGLGPQTSGNDGALLRLASNLSTHLVQCVLPHLFLRYDCCSSQDMKDCLFHARRRCCVAGTATRVTCSTRCYVH